MPPSPEETLAGPGTPTPAAPSAWHDGWNDPDATPDPDWYVRFLGATRPTMLASGRRDPAREYAALAISPGDRVLEVGCGLGDESRLLALLAGPSGQVVGLDRSHRILSAAAQRASPLHPVEAAPVRFVQGDVEKLGFVGATFDCCWARAVFQHLEDPTVALAELVRVARPGARVGISDADWDSFTVDAGDPKITGALLDYFRGSIRSRRVARELPRLFRASGLAGTRVIERAHADRGRLSPVRLFLLRQLAETAAAQGVVTPAAAESWLRELEAAHREGRCFASVTNLIVLGRVPG